MYDAIEDLLSSYGSPNLPATDSGLLSGPGLTPAAFSGALGPDDVRARPATPVSSANNDLLSPDVSNAGIAAVPQFAPPVNPATPIHHTFLGGILARLKGIGSGVVNDVSAPDPTLAGSPDLTDADRARAKSNAFLALGNALLNPRYDARGFRQSTLGALSTGLANSRSASDETLEGANNTHAAMLQRAQATQLATRRATLQAQFQILPTDTPEQIDTKIRQLAFGYSQIGDTKSLEALGQSKALFAQPKPAPLPRSLEHVELLDPKTGKPAIGLIDPASGEVVKYLPAVRSPTPALALLLSTSRTRESTAS